MRLEAVPYLGFVSKKRLVDVHNTRSTQHEWCIMIQKPPVALVWLPDFVAHLVSQAQLIKGISKETLKCFAYKKDL